MSVQLLICKFAVFTCVSFFLPMLAWLAGSQFVKTRYNTVTFADYQFYQLTPYKCSLVIKEICSNKDKAKKNPLPSLPLDYYSCPGFDRNNYIQQQ